MEWDDYLRQQTARPKNAVVKKELLELADVCRSPTTSRIVLQAGKWHEPIFTESSVALRQWVLCDRILHRRAIANVSKAALPIPAGPRGLLGLRPQRR